MLNVMTMEGLVTLLSTRVMCSGQLQKKKRTEFNLGTRLLSGTRVLSRPRSIRWHPARLIARVRGVEYKTSPSLPDPVFSDGAIRPDDASQKPNQPFQSERKKDEEERKKKKLRL